MRICADCPEDISSYHGGRIRCTDCGDKARDERHKLRRATHRKVAVYLHTHAPETYAKIVREITRRAA